MSDFFFFTNESLCSCFSPYLQSDQKSLDSLKVFNSKVFHSKNFNFKLLNEVEVWMFQFKSMKHFSIANLMILLSLLCRKYGNDLYCIEINVCIVPLLPFTFFCSYFSIAIDILLEVQLVAGAVRVVIEDIVPCFMISYWSERTINRVSRVHSFVCHEISSRLTRNWSLQTSSSWWSSTTVLSFLLQDSSLKHFLLRPS